LIAWHPLEQPLTFTIPPKTTQGVRLSVRRAAMPRVASKKAEYASVLKVSGDDGSSFAVGVKATRQNSNTGLWVGTVTLNAVSEAGNPLNNTEPTPSGGEFRFRLIVHFDEDEDARLLQEVFIMQEDPGLPPDNAPVDETPVDEAFERFTPEEPADYVLLTDAAMLDDPDFMGVAMRDGEIVGRRISSPAFPLMDPLPLAGAAGGQLKGQLVMDYDDPLNPFVHRFHPDHDNFDERYERTLTEGFESYTFSRSITLTFSDDDIDDIGRPGWGYELLGGTYEERISGVHRRDIYVKGTFILNRVLDVGELTPAPSAK